jgi:solute carrier family 25 carnitine/acylcarnitine transporter 20/29
MEGREPRVGDAYIRMAKDFTAGFVSGAISTYVGYPLDTIKVRMQVSDVETSIVQNLSKIIRNEGVSGLFKGVLSPVIGSAPVNAVIFASNDLSKRVMKNWNASEDTKVFLSGCIGGLASCAVIGPSELLKIKKQGFEGQGRSYWFLIRSEGIRGLYAGLIPTMWRDVPTFGVYFYSYDYLQKVFIKEKTSSQNSYKEIVGKMVAGGLAGQLTWIISYPFDVIKSYIQYHPEHKGTISTGAFIYRRYGIRRFFKGLAPCLMRAFPVNAILFISYEQTLKFLEPL